MDNYKSILHDMVHSKRSSLESSGSFPQLKANSLFCSECSKNMLSYIAVIQDVLDVVVGDIAEKTSGKNEGCLHIKSSPNSADVPAPKRPRSSRKKRQSLGDLPVNAAAFEYRGSENRATRPNNIPTFSESSYRSTPSSQTPPSSTHLVQHVFETFMAPKEQPVVEPPAVESKDTSTSKDSGIDISLPVIGQLEGLKLQDSTDARHEDTERNINTPARDYNESLPFDEIGLPVTPVEDAGQNLHCQVRPLHESDLQFTPLQDNFFQSVPLQDFHEKVSENNTRTTEPASNGVTSGREVARDAVIGVRETISRRRSIDNATLSAEQRNSPVLDPASEQAYVTLATSNLSGLSCLVLGYSLLAARTTRSLVVLVTEGVCSTLRYHLSTVFNIVQSIESLGTRETTTISLLENPELGISFVKLHVWQLRTFRKCVFLDPDTLVVQNCDELFKRDELSAVPDIGWPDCFNSSVFVFVPSLDTFWDLIEFLEDQDSYDGGDQGLLNMYFSNWASDISRKLPFLYNMMANVSYTYKPALKQFGKDVKIVHFFGSYKPWSVPFHSVSGDLLPTANVHPTYVQFVKFWLDIFVSCVMPLFDEDVLNYCHSHDHISVQDLLQFFHSPNTPETLPVQPSFRVYPDSMHEDSGDTIPNSPELDANEQEEDVQADEDAEDVESTLPGSELGDYRGMEAWEQGRADYLGLDKSDRIMARLDFLMQGTSKSNEKS